MVNYLLFLLKTFSKLLLKLTSYYWSCSRKNALGTENLRQVARWLFKTVKNWNRNDLKKPESPIDLPTTFFRRFSRVMARRVFIFWDNWPLNLSCFFSLFFNQKRVKFKPYEREVFWRPYKITILYIQIISSGGSPLLSQINVNRVAAVIGIL